MSPLEKEIEQFTAFAKANDARAESLDELFDHWREQSLAETDARAIAASLRDMETGETGRPFDEFSAEFRTRNGLNP